MISQTVTNRFSEQQILKGQNWFSEKTVCDPQNLPAVFKKKEFGFCATTVCLWAQKASVIWQYYKAFSDKATPNKWLQTEPVTYASSAIRLGVVPAEPRVMLFATGVMKTKPLYCNGLVIFNIVESRQKEWKKQTD